MLKSVFHWILLAVLRAHRIIQDLNIACRFSDGAAFVNIISKHVVVHLDGWGWPLWYFVSVSNLAPAPAPAPAAHAKPSAKRRSQLRALKLLAKW